MSTKKKLKVSADVRIDGNLTTGDSITYSANAAAIGLTTKAGSKAYRVIGTSQEPSSNVPMYTQLDSGTYTLEAIDDNLKVGLGYTYRMDHSGYNVGKITAINKKTNTITVKPYIVEYMRYSDEAKTQSASYISIVDHPEFGLIDVGYAASAEGYETLSRESAAHAEGFNTKALGRYSHTEGRDTAAWYGSHAEGSGSNAMGECAHAEGHYTNAEGFYSHSEGMTDPPTAQDNYGAFGKGSHNEGLNTTARGDFSHAEGKMTEVTKEAQDGHAEGYNTQVSQAHGHAEGGNTIASGRAAHAEGENGEASGVAAHKEGQAKLASGTASHAEGIDTQATAGGAHAEGAWTKATAAYAHAEGKSTKATSAQAHSEGTNTEARAENSHAEGWYTVANCKEQHVQGRYNVIDTENKYAHIVGGGNVVDGVTKRENIHTLGWDGNAWYAGSVTASGGFKGNASSADTLTIKELENKDLDKIHTAGWYSLNTADNYKCTNSKGEEITVYGTGFRRFLEVSTSADYVWQTLTITAYKSDRTSKWYPYRVYKRSYSDNYTGENGTKFGWTDWVEEVNAHNGDYVLGISEKDETVLSNAKAYTDTEVSAEAKTRGEADTALEEAIKDAAIFDEDLKLTMTFGKYTADRNGIVTVPAAGKSVKEVIQDAFINSTIDVTKPSATLTTTTSKTVEVGTPITPNYQLTWNAGSYQYGPESAITPSYNVTFNDESKTSANGTFSAVTKSTKTSLVLTAVTSWNKDTVVPVDALGNELPDMAISAGSETDTITFNWLKYCFYGFRTNAMDITSTNIRALTSQASETPLTSVSRGSKWTHFYYAVPGTKKITKAKDSNNLPLTVSTKVINVKDASGSNENSYTVSYIENLKEYSATTLTLTWG